MLTLLYIFQFILALFLLLLIFVQKRQETTALLSSNTYNSMFKSMAVPPNPLVKFTIIVGVLFFVNCIIIGGYLLKVSRSENPIVKEALKVSHDNQSNHSKSQKSLLEKAVPSPSQSNSVNSAQNEASKAKKVPQVPRANTSVEAKKHSYVSKANHSNSSHDHNSQHSRGNKSTTVSKAMFGGVASSVAATHKQASVSAAGGVK